MKKILIVIGTRPEAVKMVPVIKELRPFFEVKVTVTAQHRSMLDQVLNLFEIIPDYDLNLMRPNQDLFDITINVLKGIKKILLIEKPDIVLVHGDTSTSMVTSLASFYLQIPVAHIEAGLRTNKIYSPFPEELNRQFTSLVAKYHFAPTKEARKNLLNEQIPDEQIFVTGNTVIDSLFSIIDKARAMNFSNNLLSKLPFLNHDCNKIPHIILVTGHRRENLGMGFEEICYSLKELAEIYDEIEIIYPVHLNPNVMKPVKDILSGVKNIHLIDPLDYLPFIKLMDMSYIVLTDSGGVQEEAPSLGKPVLVMRDTTERPEALKAGTVRLVGANKKKIISEVNKLLTDEKEYKKMAKTLNPYGDGKASKRILKTLIEDNSW